MLSKIVTLFNLQGTRRFRRNILHYNSFHFACQVLFSKFFDFRDPAVISSNFIKLPHRKAFVKLFFEVFFKIKLFKPCRSASAPTALLEYHPIHHLSTPFFIFLSFYLIPFISRTNRSHLYCFFAQKERASSPRMPSYSLYQQRLQLLSVDRRLYRFRDLRKVCN